MKTIHASVLFPLLLGGCSLHPSPPAGSSDARQFLDSLIIKQISVIELAGNRLKQASRSVPVEQSQTTKISKNGRGATVHSPGYLPKTAKTKPTATGLVSVGYLLRQPPLVSVTGQSNRLKTASTASFIQPPLKRVTPQTTSLRLTKKMPLVPPPPPLKVWKFDKGATLRKGFDAWVNAEKCPSGNGKWSVRWDTDTDYAIDYPLTFLSKNFEEATTQLFTLYQKAQVPLYVSGYRRQCLIVISDKK